MTSLPDTASERWRTAHSALGDLIDEVLVPAAGTKEAMDAYGAHGWSVPRPEGAHHDSVATTFDAHNTRITIKEQSSGMSLYLEWAGEYTLLDRFRDDLAPTGLKLMRGCVKWTRKGEYPVDALKPVLEHIRDTDHGA